MLIILGQLAFKMKEVFAVHCLLSLQYIIWRDHKKNLCLIFNGSEASMVPSLALRIFPAEVLPHPQGMVAVTHCKQNVRTQYLYRNASVWPLIDPIRNIRNENEGSCSQVLCFEICHLSEKRPIVCCGEKCCFEV